MWPKCRCFPPGTRTKNATGVRSVPHIDWTPFFWRPCVHPSKIFCSERNSGGCAPSYGLLLSPRIEVGLWDPFRGIPVAAPSVPLIADNEDHRKQTTLPFLERHSECPSGLIQN